MATVSSVLSESTTTISSAQRTDANALPMSAASFLVMIVTDSFGTAPEFSAEGRSHKSRLKAGTTTIGSEPSVRLQPALAGPDQRSGAS